MKGTSERLRADEGGDEKEEKADEAGENLGKCESKWKKTGEEVRTVRMDEGEDEIKEKLGKNESRR